MDGKVWIKPHSRGGKQIKGYWRKVTSSSSSRGGGERPVQKVKVETAKVDEANKKMTAENALTTAQIAKAKLVGFVIHSSGKILYYDDKRKDFYTTTGYSGGRSSLELKSRGAKIEASSSGGSRVYFKKNKRSVFESILA